MSVSQPNSIIEPRTERRNKSLIVIPQQAKLKEIIENS
jgi:hypothetical protein